MDRNRHIQTILPILLPKPKYEYRREYVPMEDGGQIALDWGVTGTENVRKDSTILFVLPGLTGDNRGFKPLCKRAAEQGLRPVVFNKRGHGNTVLTTPKLQSFGDTTDMRTTILHIHKLFPEAKIVAIGHSAGSGLLACYLGTFRYDSFISAACCVSPGYDGLKLFSKPLPWPYDFLLLRGLKGLVREHAHILSKAVDVKHVLQSKTIREFDHRFYCKVYGIPDLDSFWAINDPAVYAWHIKIPCLCLSATDDPVISKDLICHEKFLELETMVLATVDSGAHCGFVDSSWQFWLYCHLYGIGDVNEYWNINNPDFPKVEIPTLCINSTRDPIFPEWIIPTETFRTKPNSVLVTLRGGGHCGFLAQGREHWADVVALEFVLTSLSHVTTNEGLYRVLYGFPDLDSYWSRNNPMDHVWNIQIPCLCLSALEDPVIPRRMIEYEPFTEYEHALLVTTEHGGHCGFLDHRWAHWADELTLDFLLNAKEFCEKTNRFNWSGVHK